ncbi:hypothetical protein LSH36_293g03036 [Paralvinella palmiformis]|uniref:G-protein coupled receptors family 1 profile domain-containing protein n=1 Tax=Paralvinella palmiformis TaxID=53620 RepID=A0AAD9JIF2_9ANNE|nr:hypothetical protein LSH36_293g03036 [Paralvinella palmiformis]
MGTASNNSENVALNASSALGARFTLENHLWIYSSCFLLIFGLSGSLLTMFVTFSRPFRATSSGIYLSTLAFAHFTLLLAGLVPEFLHQLHVITLWEENAWTCRTDTYVCYISVAISVWTLTLLSCDRYVADRFPLKRALYCTCRRATVSCGAVFVAANLNAHVFWSRGTVRNNDTLVSNCAYLPEYLFLELSVRPVVTSLIVFILPSIVITASFLGTVFHFNSAQRRQRSAVSALFRCNDEEGWIVFSELTVLCLITSAAFLLLHYPSLVIFIGSKWWQHSSWYPLAKAITNQLTYAHPAINFLLYSKNSQRFRDQLMRIFRAKKPRRNSSVRFQPASTDV